MTKLVFTFLVVFLLSGIELPFLIGSFIAILNVLGGFYSTYSANRRASELQKQTLRPEKIEVVECLWKAWKLTIREGNASPESLQLISTALKKATFLFSKKEISYIKSVYEHSAALMRSRAEYRDIYMPYDPHYDHKKNVAESMSHLYWLIDQFENRKMEAQFQKSLCAI